jgi:hypothetical protein
LTDEISALVEAEYIPIKEAELANLGEAVDSIGNAELTALYEGIVIAGGEATEEEELAEAFGKINLIVWILSQAAEAAQ